jgi:hypothetical protein
MVRLYNSEKGLAVVSPFSLKNIHTCFGHVKSLNLILDSQINHFHFFISLNTKMQMNVSANPINNP